jgi:uncharacterized damage-inducible protein DinB
VTGSGARAALIVSLEETPERLAEAVRRAKSAEGGRSESAGWTARQVVAHLVAVERVVWHARLAELEREDDPHWTWIEPGAEPGHRSTGQLIAAFRSARATTVAILEGLDDAGWARSGTHATFGVLDVAGLVRETLAHDEDHLAGLARSARP